MSHFEQKQNPSSSLPQQQTGLVINSDTLMHYGIILFLILSIFITAYLLVTRCTRYWKSRLEDWGRQLANSDKNE